MATNKHATIRYQALDRCFRNRFKRFDIESLIEVCNDAIYEYTGIKEGVKRRQVYADIAFMKSEQGWSIPLEHIKDGRKVYFRYMDSNFSINSQPLTDSELEQLKETILMLNRFKGMPQFEWMEELLSKLEGKFHLKGEVGNYIGFEQNPYLEGLGYISVLFNAVVNKQALSINYKGFDKPSQQWLIHPYYIKQYNNRWFLFGLNDEFNTISNLPLDRIVSVEQTSMGYVENENIDFEEFFDDIVGVTIPADAHVEQVLLQFSPERLHYVLSKPIHHSQKIKNRELGIIEVSVIPNKELESLILSFGSQVEVLSPANLRCRIGQQIDDLQTKYTSVHIGCTNK